ncbi:MAG: hypothetical protein WC334_01480 [Kiritimatiellales bacterium]|jgi:hypothetical protein
MKKLLIGLLAAAAFCAHSGADEMAARFELCRPLESQPGKGTAGRLRLPGDVFDQTRNFPADLRILDQAGTQWPFFITTPVDRTLSEKRVPQMLNKAFVGGREPHWEFDLLLPEKDRLAVHNRLEISTGGYDFVRRVEIFRDAENGTRAHLASGYLICFPENRAARNQTVSYPDSDAVRLHVQVYTSAKNAAETFDVHSAAVYCLNKIPAEREPVAAVRCPVAAKETDERTQTFILDTGFKNRPVEFITFDAAGTSFVRCVSVSGRNAENEPWQSAGGGEIHRLEKDTELTIRVQAAYRWIKTDIRKDDNLPLEIREIRLEAIPRYLVFEAASERPARFCFRGWDIPAPGYDLRRRIPETDALMLPLFATGPAEPNKGTQVSCFRKYSKMLGGVAVGAVSLLTVWIIISMMRRQQNTD